MKAITIYVSILVLLFTASCRKKVCPTYKDSQFHSMRKHQRLIRQYQSGKLVAKIRKEEAKKGDDKIRNSKKKSKKKVPSS